MLQELEVLREQLRDDLDPQETQEWLEALDGVSGVAMAERELPDLILMDINLPDIDGLEATKRIKENPKLAHIPIVALTANAMYGDEERILAGGCDGYISKPVSKGELVEIVATTLAEHA